MNDLIKKIQQNGYWKITIYPGIFKEDLIPSRNDCKRIVAESKVVLRGWDYPHMDQEIRNISKDSIDSQCDWPEGPKFEYWRYYQSGQFVHYFAMREDYMLADEKKAHIEENFPFDKEKVKSIKLFLSILSTLYSITEIFAFAANLAQRGVLTDNFMLKIELHNVKNRMLYFWDVWRHLNRAYICDFAENKIEIKKNITSEDIIKNAPAMALDTTIEIFKDFGWDTVNRNIFMEDQRKFLERRI